MFNDSFLGADMGPPLWFLIIFFGIFALIVGGILLSVISHLKERRKPIIPVQAKVLGKRMDVSGHDHSYTTYYVTFQLMNGERIEFKVPDQRAGLIFEGDEGTLTFQGRLFVDFQRK